MNVLCITASARTDASISRMLSTEFVESLAKKSDIKLVERDVSGGLPVVDEAWVEANTTPVEQRSDAQKSVLALSDQLVQELMDTDLLVIATPIYNFSVPASLKTWIDLIARAGLTFKYTPDGPQGLLEGKRAVLLVASGGTQIGSEIDFCSGYLKHVMKFIGIEDTQIAAAPRLKKDEASGLKAGRNDLAQIINNL